MKKPITLFLCFIVLMGCTTAAAFGQENVEYAASFSYMPPFEKASRTSAVTFTVGNILYKTNNGIHWFASTQFAAFPGAFRKDLTAILVSKGFRVTGPYESFDVIPFQDKKAIDLLLAPTVELTVTFKDHKEKAENMWMPAADQIQTGTAEVRGKVLLKMLEITTQELMWVKTIPFTDFSFPYFVQAKFEEYERIKKSGSGKLYNYNPVFNGMARGIEEQYPYMMGIMDGLIDPEEAEIIKKQCQEIKSKKGY